VSGPWASPGQQPAGPQPGSGPAGSSVTLIDGSTFCIADSAGDIERGHVHGLFVRDTRMLSRWELTVDGLAPQPLSVQQREPYAATFLCRRPPRRGRADSTLLVIRHRYVGGGMREDVTIRNTAARPARCIVALAADTDFADLFEVKAGRSRMPVGAAGRPSADAGGGGELLLSGRRGSRRHEVVIRADRRPSSREGRLTWRLTIPGHGEQTLSIEVVPATNGAVMRLRHPRGEAAERSVPAAELRQWRRQGPYVRTADDSLGATLQRSVEDIGALRIFDPDHPDRPVVAAGAPWFMALFGRDSLLTSWMLLPWDTDLAVGTLQTLAERQGQKVDRITEEEPGKILHEVRFGPAATTALDGSSAYYGTVDATPLFVMVLGELARWGHDDQAVAELLPHADRALEWIQTYGDADGDGFVEYARKTSRGLVNQGWKDSWDGINFADGTIARPPIALAEVQGYTFAAYRARAHLARAAGDKQGERHWRGKAAALKRAFNERFWLPERGWYAVGLDAGKHPIDALTSNVGHCLWTGIADAAKAESVARHLLSPQMFTGWGIRTLASTMAAYNPMSYHNGSVWPHDNAICAAGLVRYGFIRGAQQVAEAIMDAAAHFGYRLPELFCGFDRDDFAAPVPYPTSCSPQAWAAAAPLQLLHALLRIAPELTASRLWCAPALPRRYLPLRVSGLRLSRSRLTIDVEEDGWDLAGLDGTRIELIGSPRPSRAG
jgi:glycogen debranching enzyme